MDIPDLDIQKLYQYCDITFVLCVNTIDVVTMLSSQSLGHICVILVSCYGFRDAKVDNKLGEIDPQM